MKTGDQAIVDPKLTGLDSWVKGEVIDIEKNPFKGIIIAIKDEKGAYFLANKNTLK
jgi:hypothetical protein